LIGFPIVGGMATNLGYMPRKIVGGETILRDADTGGVMTFDGYSPADGYSLAYQFAAETPFTVDADPSDDDAGWTIEITGAQTLAIPPGVLPFVGMVSKTVDGVLRSFAVDQGVIDVAASPLRVSAWQAVLAQVDAAMADYASNPHGTINTDGMSVTYRSFNQLSHLRDYALMMLRKDTSARMPHVIRSRFQYL